MPAPHPLIQHIDRYDRARRKAAKHRTEPPSRADFLRQLAQLWQQAGEEKYRDYSGRIALARLIEEHKADRNTAQVNHWLNEYARHTASHLANNPPKTPPPASTTAPACCWNVATKPPRSPPCTPATPPTPR